MLHRQAYTRVLTHVSEIQGHLGDWVLHDMLHQYFQRRSFPKMLPFLHSFLQLANAGFP